MRCPSCDSDDARRSRRRGLREGFALRLRHLAPYRCRDCGTRFVAPEESDAADGAPHPVSFANYLGLRSSTRRALADPVVMTVLGGVPFLILILLFFAVAYGWIDLRSYLPGR